MTRPLVPTLSLHVDRQLVPAGAEAVRFVVARVVAPRAPHGWERPPVSVGFAIDRSSSMRGAKLAQAKRAVVEALGRLGARDRFSIVAFDAEAHVVAAGLPATPAHVEAAVARVTALAPGRGTNLADGWLGVARSVEETMLGGEGSPRDLVGRCVLLTDGQASCGVVDPHLLVRHATTLRSRGVSTSAFGLGLGFDEALLSRIVDAGGGSFRFLDGDRAIAPAVHDELGDALDVVSRRVQLRIAASADAKVGVLGPYPTALAGRTLEVTLPDLVSEQVLELVIHVEIRAREEGQRTAIAVQVGRDGATQQRTLRHAAVEALRAQRGDRDVIALVARRFAAAARERAALMNRAGMFQRAADELRDVARRLRSYVGRDPALGEIAAGLEVDAEEVGERLDEAQRKSMFAVAASMVRSRRPDGGSWRP